MGCFELRRDGRLLAFFIVLSALPVAAQPGSGAGKNVPPGTSAGGTLQGNSGAGGQGSSWLTPLGSVMAALITASATIIAARQKARAESFSKQVDELQAGVQKLGQGLPDLLIDRYGYKVQSTLMKVEIGNLSGDAVMTRVWSGIEIVRDVSLAAIPVKAGIESPNGKLSGPPLLTNTSSNGQPFTKDVSLDLVALTERSCDYLLTVAGALTRQDPPLDIRTTLGLTAGYVLAQDQLATAYPNAAFKYEYISLLMDIPTQVLEIEVHFPTGYQAQAFAGVFLWDTEFMHQPELQRIRNGLEILAEGARLTVEQPLLGLSYLIYWRART